MRDHPYLSVRNNSVEPRAHNNQRLQVNAYMRGMKVSPCNFVRLVTDAKIAKQLSLCQIRQSKNELTYADPYRLIGLGSGDRENYIETGGI